MDKLFTSESVALGHPDRMADTIGNAILTDILKHDKNAHVGIEALLTKNFLVLSGEVSSTYYPDYEKIARETVREIGYTKPEYGFCFDTFQFINKVNSQSSDIAQGVNRENGVIGAGDQGIIFGFAVNETENLYPLAATIANALTTRYQEFIKGDANFRPDAKSQVTINYSQGTIDTIVFAASHNESVSTEYIEKTIKENVIYPVLKELVEDSAIKDVKILINATGKFVICGPEGDAGVIGRKLVVDSYGGYGKIGGGCTNAKDPSKVDASAARAARHAAKNLVAAEICEACEIQLSYAIGVAKPVSISVDTFGTGVISDVEIAEILADNYDFSPAAIIKNLHLCDADYKVITSTGQFGQVSSTKVVDGETVYLYPWEELNLVEDFKKLFVSKESSKAEKPASEESAQESEIPAEAVAEEKPASKGKGKKEEKPDISPSAK